MSEDTSLTASRVPQGISHWTLQQTSELSNWNRIIISQ